MAKLSQLWWLALPVGAGAAAVLLSGDETRDPNVPSPPAEDWPSPKTKGVAFARGGEAPLWPIDASSTHPRKFVVSYQDESGGWHGNRGRAFGVGRPDGAASPTRHHAGVDLFANGEDILVATEGGIVVGRQPLYKGTGGLMLQTDSGVNVFYGEILMGSPDEFGVDVNTRVERGQPLARVGWHDEDLGKPGIQGGAHMLHLEMYEPGIKQNRRWYAGGSAPKGLLDPTEYLLRARAATTAVA